VRHDDADAAVGTFGTDDAIGFDPFPMLAVMQSTGANYAVFGQVAGILHGSSEPTGDLDLLWDGNADVVDNMSRAFGLAGVELRDENGDAVEVADFGLALAGRKVYFEGVQSAGDLCTTRLPWGALDIHGILRRKVWAHEGAITIPFLALDDLIAMRSSVAGVKHARRLEELRRISSEQT
jgi:hypothetical protein